MSLLFWSAATIALFFGTRVIFMRTKNSLLHPVLWSTVALIVLIEITGHTYPAYAYETSWMVWFLGPAVVALSAPIYRLRGVLLTNAIPFIVVVVFAVLFSMTSVYLLLMAFPLDRSVMQALTLKSITAPVAFEIAKGAHLLPALAAVGVMFAGLMGAIFGPWVLRMGRVRDPRAMGLALGCTSHGVGTARALELGETQGVFASLGMSCSAIAASLICPVLLLYVFH